MDVGNKFNYLQAEVLKGARDSLPKGKSKEFYEGYTSAMIESIALVKQFTGIKVLNEEQLEILTVALNAFYISAQEQQG